MYVLLLLMSGFFYTAILAGFIPVAMRFDQNGPTKRTDLVCDDLPPIEAQQFSRFLLRAVRYYEHMLVPR